MCTLGAVILIYSFLGLEERHLPEGGLGAFLSVRKYTYHPRHARQLADS